MSFTAVRVVIGRGLIAFGVLTLLFIPYVLWGTGIVAAQHQAALRQQFDAARQRAGATTPPTTPPAPTGPPQVAPATPGPAVGSAVGQLSIPSIGLTTVVVEGTGEPQLQMGPGHYPGTPLPGQAGNAAIAGHRTTYLHPFYDLGSLKPGDAITVVTLQGTFTYRVTGSQVVTPNDVTPVAPTPTPQLTLTTCTPLYSASHRLVVHAALAASVLAHPASAGAPPTPATTVPPARSHPATAPSSASGLAGGSGSWLPALLWGLVLVAVATALWALARHRSRRARLTIYGAGAVIGLVVLFFFYGAVTPLLPASF